MNRGGVRDSLAAGPVTARHVWNILPFENVLVEADVRAESLPAEATAGRDVEPGRTYRFVTNDFSAGLPEFKGLRFRPTAAALRDTFLEWIKSKGHIP